MIVKNVKSGKYEMIKNEHSYYFDAIFSKYNINIISPIKKIHILIQEKRSTMFICNHEYIFVLKKFLKLI